MGGYDPNQPRDKEGQWEEYGGRPKANYARPKEAYGTPRVSIQYATSFNPSDPRAHKDALAAEAKRLKSMGYQNVSSGNLTNPAKRQLKTERLMKLASVGQVDLEKEADKILKAAMKGKTYDPLSQISGKSLFQNLNEGQRRNYNIGSPPRGMSEPPTGEYRTILSRQAEVRKARMAQQASARSARDAMVDKILRSPFDIHYAQIGTRKAEALQPTARNARRFNKAERVFDWIWRKTGGD